MINCGEILELPVLLRLENLIHTEAWWLDSLHRSDIEKRQKRISVMGRPKRHLLATAAETSSPPSVLDQGHFIALVKKAEGNNLYSVELPSGKEPLLVELPSRFRSQIWIKRGGYVVVDRSAFDDRENKLGGEIVNVVREEKQWRKQAYWYVFQSSSNVHY